LRCACQTGSAAANPAHGGAGWGRSTSVERLADAAYIYTKATVQNLCTIRKRHLLRIVLTFGHLRCRMSLGLHASMGFDAPFLDTVMCNLLLSQRTFTNVCNDFCDNIFLSFYGLWSFCTLLFTQCTVTRFITVGQTFYFTHPEL
jgi:hypothetical protein